MNATAIGLFRSGITPIDRLLETTVGRNEMLDDLLGKLRRGADKKGVQHFVFIGPRGIGKTHFLTLLETAVTTNEDLNKRYSVIRFPEENIRVLSFADMLLCIVQILSETTDGEEWKSLYTAQSTNEDDQTIVDAVVPRLKNYRAQTGKMLLVLLENLDSLLSQQIKDPQDIHRLRTFLMDSPCVTLVATSPVYFPGLYDVKSPLYDFFDVQVIEDLSEDQTIDLIKRNLEWEKRKDLLEGFGNLVPKIRTIHIMTGGNPRLIMMLYQLVANDAILDTKVQFQKLLDQISPFYQDRLRDLAPQERAVLETIALMRDEPRTPAAIAKRLRKSPQLLSSLLQRMAKAGYLIAIENPDDKRSKIYRIKEGFFDLWLAMSESRLHKKRLPYLVDFLSRYFQDQAEREKKREELSKICESPECDENKKKNSKELLDFLSEIGPIAPIKPVFEWMIDQTEKIGTNLPDKDIVKWFSNLIEYWKNQRSGDLEKAAEIAQNIGNDFSDNGLHEIKIELLKDAVEHTGDEKTKISFLIDIALCKKTIGQMDSALEELAKATELSITISDRINEGRALNHIGQIISARGDYNKAIGIFKQSLSIAQATKNRHGEGAALNNISQIYAAQGDYGNALNYLKQSLSICLEIYDQEGESTVLNNIGQLYYFRGDFKNALHHSQQSLAICEKISNKAGQGTALNYIGQIYFALGEYDKALKCTKESLSICHEIRDKDGEATALNNLSAIDNIRGDYESAFSYLEQSLALSREIQDKIGFCTTLFNIGHIIWAKKDISQALQVWANVYKLAKPVQLTQVLEALKKLAETIKLPGGMEGWEKLTSQEQGGLGKNDEF